MPLLLRLDRNGTPARALAFVVLLAFGASIAGCSRPASSGTGLRVVATTSVFADIVAQVAGERASVVSLVPAGVGPEDYQPKPDDSRKVSDAQLIVSNGVGLDTFLDKLLANTGSQAARLVLGDGIPTIQTEGAPNPHFWLDPSLVAGYYLPAIREKLSALDPDGAPTFAANATAYAAKLQQLDTELQAKVAELPADSRKLVTFHDAFPYFARHFGFELIGVIVSNVGQDPSARDLADLVAKVKAAHVKAVFSEVQFNPKLAQTLADEAGVSKVVTTLYNDALGPAPADSYVGMMRWNVDQVVEALK